MALTKTDIANQALGRIGSKRIMTITDEESAPARVCRTFLEQTVREVGRLHRWNCLSKRKSLAQLSDEPAFGWDAQFQLPSDFLRLSRLNGEDAWERQDFYSIEGRRLLTNAEEANVIYIAYVEDSTQYDALFSEAVIVLLASKIAVPIRQDERMAEALRNEFEVKTLPRGRRIDGSEEKRRQYDYVKESRWVKARRISTNG